MSRQQVNAVPRLYKSVIDDVINSVRDVFLDEGLDEQVLQELKTVWEGKLAATRAVDSDRASGGVHPHNLLSTQLAAQQQRERLAAIEEQKRIVMESLAAVHRPPDITSGGGMKMMMPEEEEDDDDRLHLGSLGQLDGSSELFRGMAVRRAEDCGEGTSKDGMRKVKEKRKHVVQLDGPPESSDDDEDDDDDEAGGHQYRDGDADLEDDDEEGVGAEEEGGGDDDDPLNSDDDVSDDEPGQLFETENVVVCQYEKVSRVRSRWKFNLKDGIMNLNGKDHVFQKAIGEAEW